MISQGLIGQWTMDDRDTDNGMLRDKSAFDNHGSLNGGVTTGASGIVGEAYDFDGSDDTVDTGQQPSDYNLTGNVNITITAWATPSVFNRGGVWEFGNQSELQEFSMRTTDSESIWRAQLWSAGDIDFTAGSNNETIHLALVHNANNTETSVFVNGSFKKSQSQTLDLSDGDTLKFGLWSNNYFEGKINDVRIYDRVLSENEINQLYNKRTSIGTKDPGLFVDIFDTQTWFDNNSHPNNKSELNEFYDDTNSGVVFDKSRNHNRQHIYWGSSGQNSTFGTVNSYPYYILVNSKDGYSWRLEGDFVAPETGTYTFGIDGDDATEVQINGNVVVGWYGGHGFDGDVANHTGTVDLTEGNSYDFKARFEEGTGGDGIAVAWQKPSDSSFVLFPLDLLRPNFS